MMHASRAVCDSQDHIEQKEGALGYTRGYKCYREPSEAAETSVDTSMSWA